MEDNRPQIQFKNGSGNLGPQINAHEKQKKVKYIFVRAYSDAQGALPPLGIKLKISKQNLETMPQKVNFCHSRKNFFKSLNGEN